MNTQTHKHSHKRFQAVFVDGTRIYGLRNSPKNINSFMTCIFCYSATHSVHSQHNSIKWCYSLYLYENMLVDACQHNKTQTI